MNLRRYGAVLVAGFVWVALAAGAEAQDVNAPDKKAQAKAHFQGGVAAYEKGRYQVALGEFQEAYRLAPHPMVRVNMANCYDQLGKPKEAIFHFEKFLESPESSPTQRKEVNTALKRLRMKVGRLTLHISPDGAMVQVDAAERRKAPLLEPLHLTAGSHEVSVRLEGYKPSSRLVRVEGGGQTEVTITLEREGAPEPVLAGVVPAASAAATPQAPPDGNSGPTTVDVGTVAPLDQAATEAVLDEEPLPQDTADSGGLRMTVPVIVSGASTLALALGATITGVMALGANSDFDQAVAIRNAPGTTATQKKVAWNKGQDAAGRAERLALTTDILLIGTAVGLGLTTYFLLTSDDGGERAALVSPVVTADYGGLHMQGSF